LKPKSGKSIGIDGRNQPVRAMRITGAVAAATVSALMKALAKGKRRR